LRTSAGVAAGSSTPARHARDAAAWEAEEIRALEPGFSASKWLETYPMTDANRKHRLTRLLAKIGL
jgi:hypothetical protein